MSAVSASIGYWYGDLSMAPLAPEGMGSVPSKEGIYDSHVKEPEQSHVRIRTRKGGVVP
jgi:hypothetical protein